MKRLLSSWQGLLAGILAIALYFVSPSLIRMFDPTAGAFDGGFIQWIVLASVAYLWGIFIIWVGWQIAFRSMDGWADAHLKSAFKAFPDWAKWLAVQVTFLFMGIGWLVVLKSVPVQ